MSKKSRKDISKRFIKNIQKYMKEKFQLESKSEYSLDRHSRWSAKADIFAEFGNLKLLVEVEEGQPHPDTNVTKYWPWLEKNKSFNTVALIQVFGSEFYDGSYRSRSELCEFVANKIRKEFSNFKYISIPKEKQHRYSAKWNIFKLLAPTKKAIKSLLSR